MRSSHPDLALERLVLAGPYCRLSRNSLTKRFLTISPFLPDFFYVILCGVRVNKDVRRGNFCRIDFVTPLEPDVVPSPFADVSVALSTFSPFFLQN